MEAFLVAGQLDDGTPVAVAVVVCGACGALVVTSEVSMEDHARSVHGQPPSRVA
jgi:hypothetical protein